MKPLDLVKATGVTAAEAGRLLAAAGQRWILAEHSPLEVEPGRYLCRGGHWKRTEWPCGTYQSAVDSLTELEARQ